MGDGTAENPYTREDVLRLIEANGGSENELDLSKMKFERGINLNDINLKNVNLTKARLVQAHLEGATLVDAHLEGAYLLEAHLEGADLRRAHLEGAFLLEVNLIKAILEYANLKGADLWYANLEGSLLKGANLEGVDLRRAHLERASLYGAKFSTDTDLSGVYWGNYILGEELDGKFDLAVDAYRRLKVWYTQAGYSDTAAKFFYREKEAGRKFLKLFSKNWRHRIALQFSYWVFGHGEGWKRILFWIVGVISVLAAAYYLWGTFNSSSFWDTLYYSATSFSALGYGKWAPQPIGWAKGMGAAEAIIGVSMMALFLVTFVRKWAR